MIAWWWLIVALSIGEILGVAIPHFCSMNKLKNDD